MERPEGEQLVAGERGQVGARLDVESPVVEVAAVDAGDLLGLALEVNAEVRRLDVVEARDLAARPYDTTTEARWRNGASSGVNTSSTRSVPAER